MQDTLKKGEALFAAGNIDQAESCFLGLIKEDLSDKVALNNLGVIAFSRKDTGQAREYFNRALAIDPDYTEVKENLAMLDRADLETKPEKPAVSSQTALTDCRLAIVNTFDNKFNRLYNDHFAKNNEVRLIKPDKPDDLAPILNWANIIWSTWCNEPVVALSKTDMNAALVTHIRSYEILNEGLFKNINWSRIDGAIFVADHIRQIAAEMWPRIGSLKSEVINNSIRPGDYPFYNRKPGCNIAYVGYINQKKGVSLLLQCLRAAAELDKEYCLHIAGDFQSKRHEVYIKHLVKEMKVEDNIVFHGWVDDIPAFLKDMDYIISTSPWEGCPNNIIEAMACGIKPIIHNWRGAKELFPSELVFDHIDQFISILKSDSYDSAVYRKYVEEKYNAEQMLPRIDTFLNSVWSKKANTNNTNRFKTTGNREETRKKVSSHQTARPAMRQINFVHDLPRNIEITDNRKKYVVDFCRGKKALHIGCVDSGMMEQRVSEGGHLHDLISGVAEKAIGVDIDSEGINYLREKNYDVHTLDIENDFDRLHDLTKEVEVIVVPEVIEHLNHPGKFLSNLKQCRFPGDILISVPNAFSYRNINALGQFKELVHPDHNYYFSYVTLRTLLKKHGFEISRAAMYYWPTNDNLGRGFKKLLEHCPYSAEGILAVVKDNQ